MKDNIIPFPHRIKLPPKPSKLDEETIKSYRAMIVDIVGHMEYLSKEDMDDCFIMMLNYNDIFVKRIQEGLE